MQTRPQRVTTARGKVAGPRSEPCKAAQRACVPAVCSGAHPCLTVVDCSAVLPSILARAGRRCSPQAWWPRWSGGRSRHGPRRSAWRASCSACAARDVCSPQSQRTRAPQSSCGPLRWDWPRCAKPHGAEAEEVSCAAHTARALQRWVLRAWLRATTATLVVQSYLRYGWGLRGSGGVPGGVWLTAQTSCINERRLAHDMGAASTTCEGALRICAGRCRCSGWMGPASSTMQRAAMPPLPRAARPPPTLQHAARSLTAHRTAPPRPPTILPWPDRSFPAPPRIRAGSGMHARSCWRGVSTERRAEEVRRPSLRRGRRRRSGGGATARGELLRHPGQAPHGRTIQQVCRNSWQQGKPPENINGGMRRAVAAARVFGDGCSWHACRGGTGVRHRC
jgi:hypothetical protein